MNNPVIARQKKAIFQAALANLLDDNTNMMPLQTPQVMAVQDNHSQPLIVFVRDNQFTP